VKRIVSTLTAAFLFLEPQIAMPDSDFQLLDPKHPISLKAIHVATEVFREHNPDLNAYDVQIVKDRGLLVVVFVDKNRVPGARGAGSVPGFEVELDANDLHVIRSNFVR
jgi:hypothetical protein